MVPRAFKTNVAKSVMMHDITVTNKVGENTESSNDRRSRCGHNDELPGNPVEKEPGTADTPGKQTLRSWLNKNLKIEMTDGRVLIGVFLCTDRDGNVILGSCCEYLKPDSTGSMEEPRVLGLVMVPGRHIVSVFLDDITKPSSKVS